MCCSDQFLVYWLCACLMPICRVRVYVWNVLYRLSPATTNQYPIATALVIAERRRLVYQFSLLVSVLIVNHPTIVFIVYISFQFVFIFCSYFSSYLFLPFSYQKWYREHKPIINIMIDVCIKNEILKLVCAFAMCAACLCMLLNSLLYAMNFILS